MAKITKGYFSLSDVKSVENESLTDLYDRKEKELKNKNYFENLTDIEEDAIKKQNLNILRKNACNDLALGDKKVNISEFNDKYNKNFWDPRLFFYMSCMSNITVNLTDPYVGDEKAHMGVREFWNDLKSISSGEQGFVFGGNQDFSRGYALKSSKNRFSSREEVVHEMFVGQILSAMSLRFNISNFMKTFGFIKVCGEPSQYDNKLFYACDISGSNYYGITEKVSPGTPVSKYINSKDFTAKGLISILLQVALALNTVNTNGNTYSHNDLHTGNVLIRSTGMKKQVLIPYIFGGRRIFVKADSVATIIDYGHSFIKIDKDNRGYGVTDLAYAGAYFDSPNQIMDTFKLLMFSASKIRNTLKKKKGNLVELEKSYKELKDLFTFFNSTDRIETVIDYRMDYKNNYFFNIPKVSDVIKKGYTHGKYIDYIIKTLNVDGLIVYSPSKNDIILSCDGGSCVDSDYEPPLKEIDNGRELLRLYSLTRDNELIQKYRGKLKDMLNKELKSFDLEVERFNSFYNDLENTFSEYREKTELKLKIKEKMEGNIFSRLHAFALKKYKNVTDDDVLKLGKIPDDFFYLTSQINSLYNSYLNIISFRDGGVFLYTNIVSREYSDRTIVNNKLIVEFKEIYRKTGKLLKDLSDYIDRNRLLIELIPLYQYENERRVSAKFPKIKKYQRSLYGNFRDAAIDAGYPEGPKLEQFIKYNIVNRYTRTLDMALLYKQYREFKGYYNLNHILARYGP